MNYSFKLILIVCGSIVLSCRGGDGKYSDSDGGNTISAIEEYVAGDTISTQKEDFDIDEFIKEKKEAEKKVQLESESEGIPKMAQNDNSPISAVKLKKKSTAKPKPQKKYYPEIEFVEESYEVGEIIEGDVITHTFKFKNIGKAPLNIEKAEGTCGCTQPSYPFLAIAPGEEGEIGVNYHSVGKSGPQKPEIIVHSDAKNNPIKTLFLELNVKDKPSDNPADSLQQNEG